MSNIYIQEPPTKGKVLLSTSVGDIDIELWSKEAPKACRNFVQLCLEGYYDNTIFHRIVKGFCIQGGDPTGTGSGGESIYGQPFKDEIHQRLRFVRRGLVAMANAGKDDNRSQFFFTLGRADELNGKHTIFGKVTGNTIYNMLEMENLEVDHNDYPIYPPKIYKTEVLSNPYEDIVPREKRIPVEKEMLNKTEKKAKGTKNFSLLSFGEEAEGDEEQVDALTKDLKIKSSHDILNDPKLSSVPAVDTTTVASDVSRGDDKKIAEDVRNKLKNPRPELEEFKGEEDDNSADERSDRRKELRKESKRLQRELREGKKKKHEEGDDIKYEEQKDERAGSVTEFRQERKEYLQKKNERIKKKGSGREEQTMKLLSAFQTKLENTEDKSGDNQLNDIWGDDDEDVDDMSWLHHKLVFENQERKVKDANVRDEDTYEIFDPRNPINKRRRGEINRYQKEKKRK